MATREFIVVDYPRPDEDGFRAPAPAPASIEPIEAPRIRIDHLTRSEAAEARIPGRRDIAEAMPIRLVHPIAEATVVDLSGQGNAWGVEAVGANLSEYSGKGIRVAVLDTGVDASHPAFEGVTVTHADFTETSERDDEGHGTHCAGTILGRDVKGHRIGIARGVTDLLAVKVLANNSTTAAVVHGIEWALSSGAHVLSMSLGIDFAAFVEQLVEDDYERPAATSLALEAYRDTLGVFEGLAKVVRYGGSPAILVAASGNESKRDRYTIAVSPPAAAEGMISVGALQQGPDGTLSVAPFSNTGAEVAAPGVNIVSAWPGNRFALSSGTSMATPHVAGVAALWAEHLMARDNEVDPRLLRDTVIGRAESRGLSGRDVGSGIVQAPQPGNLV
jgi:subtilisin family serine protease